VKSEPIISRLVAILGHFTTVNPTKIF